MEEEKLPNYVLPFIENISINEGFTNNKVIDIKYGSIHGDGFVGIIFNVTIKGVLINKNEKILNLICKVPPTNKIRRNDFGAMKLFEREIYMYNNVLPEFLKFQTDKNLTVGFFGIPKIYLAHFDSENDEACIIMDDLKKMNYKMCNKFESIDFPHARKLFIELGYFHAISFAMKKQKPELFEKFKELNDNILGDTYNSIRMNSFINSNCNRALTTLLPHEDYKKDKLIKLRDNMHKEMVNCVNGIVAEPYSVINHGDCWINNMMYSYKNGIPDKICLIDWQVSRYSSPVADLVYYIFCCSDKIFRNEHYENLIQIYYKALREHLERLGENANKLFPYTELLKQLKIFGKFGLGMALFIIPMLCIENDDMPDLNEFAETFRKENKLQLLNISEKNESKYNKRMGDVIRDMIRFGYL